MGRGEDGGLGGGKVRASRPARLYLQFHITPIICAHPPGTSPSPARPPRSSSCRAGIPAGAAGCGA